MNAAGAGRVLLLGYGEMGHAMQCLLSSRHEVRVWTRRPREGVPAVELEAAVAVADFVIYCVPVMPLAELAARVVPRLSAHSISLSMAKGLDASGRHAPRILADAYGAARDFGVLYGPMIAEEIRAGRPAYAQVGVSRAPVYARVAGLFADSGLAPVYSDDLHGIAWAAVLKNVYAMLFGAADALQLGDNARGCLTVTALAEMGAIIRVCGGQAVTARALAGLGDLVTTATSAGSHHHALGAQLVHGAGDLQGEGIHALAMVRRFKLLDETRYPLFALARQLVERTATATALRDFLRLAPAVP